MPSPTRPLIVRLRNWVGDVVLSLPTLQRLAAAGYALRLVGKGWARELLAGEGWPVDVLPRSTGERVALLRRLRAEAAGADPGFGRRINAVAFPYSFSSALEMRLAGLRAIGHAREARGWLLGRSVARPESRHELEVYWHLGAALLGADAPLPARIELRPTAAQRERAARLLQAHGVAPGFVMACPFAGGTFAGLDKSWPAFPAFAAADLPALGGAVVVCPGPGEETQAAAGYPGAVVIAGVDLGVYAALLERCTLMVSNDTGPGHLAAAVGAPLVSVLGPSDPAQWRAWGPTVRLVRGDAGGWPSRDAVLDAARAQRRPA